MTSVWIWSALLLVFLHCTVANGSNFVTSYCFELQQGDNRIESRGLSTTITCNETSLQAGWRVNIPFKYEPLTDGVNLVRQLAYSCNFNQTQVVPYTTLWDEESMTPSVEETVHRDVSLPPGAVCKINGYFLWTTMSLNSYCYKLTEKNCTVKRPSLDVTPIPSSASISRVEPTRSMSAFTTPTPTAPPTGMPSGGLTNTLTYVLLSLLVVFVAMIIGLALFFVHTLRHSRKKSEKLKRMRRQYFNDFKDFDNFHPVSPSKAISTPPSGQILRDNFSSCMCQQDSIRVSMSSLNEQYPEKLSEGYGMLSSIDRSNPRNINMSTKSIETTDGHDCHKSDGYYHTSLTLSNSTRSSRGNCSDSSSSILLDPHGHSTSLPSDKHSLSCTSPFLLSKARNSRCDYDEFEVSRSTVQEMAQENYHCVVHGHSESDADIRQKSPNKFASILIQAVNQALTEELDSNDYQSTHILSTEEPQKTIIDSFFSPTTANSSISFPHNISSTDTSSSYLSVNWPQSSFMNKDQEIDLDLSDCDTIECTDSNLTHNTNKLEAVMPESSCLEEDHSLTSEPVLLSSLDDQMPPQVYYETGSDYVHMQ